MATIDYSTPATGGRRIEPARLLRVALACALAPMALGTVVIVLWLATSWGILAILGLGVLLVGFILFFIGLASLIWYARSCHAARLPWVRATLRATLLLLLNFPLAFAYIRLGQMWTIHFVNAGTTTIGGLVISDPVGRRWQVGPIAPGSRATRRIFPQGEGAITFSSTAPAGDAGVSGVVSGYYTPGLVGEHRSVTINADGSSISR
jgi:hypothetical protein